MTITPQIERDKIIYPSSDGEPMAESDITRSYLIYCVKVLEIYFQNRSDVYVSGNSFIYYERGKPASVVSPDVYVVFGVRKGQRDNYKVWDEDGITPDFVLEITSKSTEKKDQVTKPELYRKLGIKEYFQYDPSGDYLSPIVQGLRLVNGNYEAIKPLEVKSYDNMRLHSDVLDLDLCLISGELRFQNTQTGDFLLTHEEEREGRIEEKQGRIQEKYARLQAEQSLKNAVNQLLKSEFTVEQIAQMMQLSVETVRLLVEE
ncbi:MAG: Uma2 family endonuclease [Cyanobacteriota bacterium]|nr:Uma2 family endonuclease [Cyanobacteriota bacterium]